MNQALARNRGGLFLRLDWDIEKHWVLHWFGGWAWGMGADGFGSHGQLSIVVNLKACRRPSAQLSKELDKNPQPPETTALFVFIALCYMNGETKGAR